MSTEQVKVGQRISGTEGNGLLKWYGEVIEVRERYYWVEIERPLNGKWGCLISRDNPTIKIVGDGS